MFTKAKEVTEATLDAILADPSDPDGAWLCEAVQHHDVADIVGGYIPQDETLPDGSYTLMHKEVRLVQYIGGRLFIETVPAFIDEAGTVWVPSDRVG